EMCANDEDCKLSELCTNGTCVIGCKEKCAWNEICKGENRTFSCECLPGYVHADIWETCKRIKTIDDSTTTVVRSYKCECDSKSLDGDDSSRCYKLCYDDSDCENNEHCNDLRQCVPVENLPPAQ
ncbi:hypothetical protein PV326_007181, partial [Microctonus aethiopoides]